MRREADVRVLGEERFLVVTMTQSGDSDLVDRAVSALQDEFDDDEFDVVDNGP